MKEGTEFLNVKSNNQKNTHNVWSWKKDKTIFQLKEVTRTYSEMSAQIPKSSSKAFSRADSKRLPPIQLMISYT